MYNFKEIINLKIADNQPLVNLTFCDMYNNHIHVLFL